MSVHQSLNGQFQHFTKFHGILCGSIFTQIRSCENRLQIIFQLLFSLFYRQQCFTDIFRLRPVQKRLQIRITAHGMHFATFHLLQQSKQIRLLRIHRRRQLQQQVTDAVIIDKCIYAQFASEVVSLFCHFLFLFVCPVGGSLLP